MEGIELMSDVCVTLTAVGAEKVNQNNTEAVHLMQMNGIKFHGYRTDYKEGDTYKAMLWEIMRLFGGIENCYNGADIPFTSLRLDTNE